MRQFASEQRDVPAKSLNAIRLRFEDCERGVRCSHCRRARRCRKDERARPVHYEFGDFAACAHKTALRTERFRKSAHQDVGMLASEMLAYAAACCAEDACGMRFVDHREGVVATACVDEPRKVEDVAVHREDGVGNRQPAAMPAAKRELASEVVHVVVAVHDNVRA